MLTEAIERIKAGIGADVCMMGILLTQVGRRSQAVTEIISLIRDHYGHKVFDVQSILSLEGINPGKIHELSYLVTKCIKYDEAFNAVKESQQTL